MENKNLKATPEAAEAATHFATLITNYETAYANGKDYTAELLALAQAAAMSVVKKCLDPNAKPQQQKRQLATADITPH